MSGETDELLRQHFLQGKKGCTPTVYDYWHNIPASVVNRLLTDEQYRGEQLTAQGVVNLFEFARRYLEQQETKASASSSSGEPD